MKIITLLQNEKKYVLIIFLCFLFEKYRQSKMDGWMKKGDHFKIDRFIICAVKCQICTIQVLYSMFSQNIIIFL